MSIEDSEAPAGAARACTCDVTDALASLRHGDATERGAMIAIGCSRLPRSRRWLCPLPRPQRVSPIHLR